MRLFYFLVFVKNYKKSIYENSDYKKTDERQATHPHQIHLELLSELGLIGYILFLILSTRSHNFKLFISDITRLP